MINQRRPHPARLEPCRSRRFGFSLVEVLIAVAITLALAALMLPDFTSFGVLSARRSAAEALQAAAHSARSHALNAAEPVQLSARDTRDGWILEARTVSPRRSETSADPDEPSPSRSIRVGRLSAGFTVVAAEAETPMPELQTGGERSSDDAGNAGPSVLIALVMPDGTFEPEGVHLVHRGRRSLITVRKWTGRVELGDWLDSSAPEPSDVDPARTAGLAENVGGADAP